MKSRSETTTDRIASLRRVAESTTQWRQLAAALTEALDLLQAAEAERGRAVIERDRLATELARLQAHCEHLERLPAQLRAEVVT